MLPEASRTGHSVFQKTDSADTSFTPIGQFALGWLFSANLIGLWLSILLVFPELNKLAGTLTYGRWAPLHLNFQLYGWVSICLLGLIFRLFLGGPSNQPAPNMGLATRRMSIQSLLWVWTSAVLIGGWQWLQGHVSGKVFLDWEHLSSLAFITAIFFIWLYLLTQVVKDWVHDSPVRRIVKTGSLVGLGLVPLSMLYALRPDVYPAVNPNSGGPTGISLFGSTLGIIFLFLLLPYILAIPRAHQKRNTVFWMVWAVEIVMFIFANHGNVSHHDFLQICSLVLLLPWPILVLMYYRQFNWNRSTLIWKNGFIFWFLILSLSAFTMFLPGINERIKFTNALVGHAHMALAGCVTSFCMMILIELPIEKQMKTSLGRIGPFIIWNVSLALMIILLTWYGWIEGQNPWIEELGTPLRKFTYVVRSILGLGMVLSSGSWALGYVRQPNLFSRFHTLTRSDISYVSK